MPGTAYDPNGKRPGLQKSGFLFFFVLHLTPLQMKIISVIALILALFSFTNSETGNATVRKIQGVEIYVYSEPTKDYDVIDTGKIIVGLTGSCEETINTAAKKAAKVQANAVIVELSSSKWSAIKFKE